MAPHLPRLIATAPQWAPLLDLLTEIYLKPHELAQRWRYSEDYVSNMRRSNRGPAFLKLPTGAILYPLAEVVAWELAGAAGPLTFERLSLALTTCKGVTPELREAIVSHVRASWGASA